MSEQCPLCSLKCPTEEEQQDHLSSCYHHQEQQKDKAMNSGGADEDENQAEKEQQLIPNCPAAQTNQPNPFKCSTCQKSFERIRYLRLHMKSHGKPSKCPNCPKSYRTLAGLRTHLKAVHYSKPKDMPYKCNKCHKAYSLSSSLVTHQLMSACRSADPTTQNQNNYQNRRNGKISENPRSLFNREINYCSRPNKEMEIFANTPAEVENNSRHQPSQNLLVEGKQPLELFFGDKSPVSRIKTQILPNPDCSETIYELNSPERDMNGLNCKGEEKILPDDLPNCITKHCEINHCATKNCETQHEILPLPPESVIEEGVGVVVKFEEENIFPDIKIEEEEIIPKIEHDDDTIGENSTEENESSQNKEEWQASMDEEVLGHEEEREQRINWGKHKIEVLPFDFANLMEEDGDDGNSPPINSMVERDLKKDHGKLIHHGVSEIPRHGIDHSLFPNSSRCEICFKYFASLESRRRHERVVHTRRFTCKTCYRSYDNKNLLARHTQQKHLLCFKCQKSFKTHECLSGHLKSQGHNTAKPHTCPHCPQSFRILSPFKCHLRSHADEEPYVCPLCKKPFPHAGAFNLHWKALHSAHHKKYKSPDTPSEYYPCYVCGKNIFWMMEWRSHLRSHTRDEELGAYSMKSSEKDQEEKLTQLTSNKDLGK